MMFQATTPRAAQVRTSLVFSSFLVSLALATCLAVAGPASAQESTVGARAGIPVPDKDPFYSQPDDIESYEAGAVIDSRPVTALAYVLPIPARTWQIKYRSADNSGRPTANVTTLLVPKTPWKGPGSRPVVSYQTAEDSAGTQCAPSYGLRTGLVAGYGGVEAGLIIQPLARNWAVVVPDYQGPDSQLLGGYAEARGVLDSMRAVRDFAPAGLSDSPMGLTGFSGGGAATAYAARMQSELAPELPIKGVVLGGVVADIHSMAKQFNTFGLKGALVMGLATLDRSYPEANLDSYLNDRGLTVMKALERECVVEAVAKYYVLNPRGTLDALTKEPNILGNPTFAAFLKRISPTNLGGTPMAPVFGYVATHDQLAPAKSALEMFRKFCGLGVKVDVHQNPLTEHGTEALVDYPRGLNYLAERFAGKPAPAAFC